VPDVETRVVGTGWIGLPLPARKYFEHGYGIDVQELHHRGKWWLDVELQPPQSMQRQIIGRRLNPEAEFTMAERFAAAECAGSGKSPQYTREPQFVGRGRHAIGRGGDAGNSRLASNEEEPLPTLRGFGNLVDDARLRRHERAVRGDEKSARQGPRVGVDEPGPPVATLADLRCERTAGLEVVELAGGHPGDEDAPDVPPAIGGDR